MKKQNAKIPLLLMVVAGVTAAIFFSFSNRQPYFLWAGVAAAVLAVIFLLVALTKFLRNRSITSGLFIATTAVTITYFLGTRFINNALPLAFPSVAVANATVNGGEALNANASVVTPVVLAQIGLFVVWFLLILFIIYVYVRPIKKIDLLLSQIIEAKEIKKMRLGKSQQYQKIAAKLQILADEKHYQEQKRRQRLAHSRARAAVKKDLVTKLLKEKDKIPTPRATE